MKVKNITGRILAGILVAVVTFTSMPQTAYATGNAVEDGQEMIEEESASDDGIAADKQEEKSDDGKDGGNDENSENTEKDNGEENVSAGDVADGTDAGNAESSGTEDALEPGIDEKEEISEEPDDADAELGAEEDGKEVQAEKEIAYQLTSARVATETIAQLKARFPAGKYWNRVNLNYNNPDGVTNTPCPDNHNTAPNTCNNYRGCAQCRGFAYRLADGYYGSCPLDGWSAGSLDSLKAGDIIIYGIGKYGTWGHTIWVTGVAGDTISLADCNVDEHCGIRWDAKTTKSKLKNIGINSVYSAPYSITETSQGQPLGNEMQGPFARTISDGDYHIVSALEGNRFEPGSKCLTIGGLPDNKNKNEANAELWAVYGSQDHVFTIKWIDEMHGYNIKLKSSLNHYLDVAGGSSERGTNIQLYEKNDFPAQQWVISESADGDGYTIQARWNGFFADVVDGSTADQTNIRLWDGNGSKAQRWYFVPWSGGNSAVQEIPDGEYEIVPKADNGKALSAYGNADVKIGTRESDGNHVFKVTYLGNGYYKIINKNLPKEYSLDVSNAGSKRGANVGLYQYWDKYNEQWIIKSCGDGYFYIVSKCNGLCVDLAIENNDDAIDGIKIHMWNIHGGDNQKWKFVPYEISKLNPPTASIPSDTEVEAGTSVSLSCGVDGAEILYTLDGTEPQAGGPYCYSYSGPIIIEQDTTVKAIAVKEGYSNSDIASFVYWVKEGTVPVDPSPEDPEPDNIPNGLWVAGLSQTGYEYTGKAIKPAVRVYDHKTLLTEKKDYTISYTRNTKAYGYASGDQGFDAKKAPTITVTAKGNYSGKETLTFKILPPDIGSNAFAADDMTIAKTKGAQKPLPVLMWKDKKLNNKMDFTVAYYDSSDNKLDYVKEAGVYYLEMTGKGNFGGTRRAKLTVTDQLKLMSKMSVTGIKGQQYTGSAITPALTVKDGKTTLTEGIHYTVSYSQNTSVGTAYAIVTGIEEAGYSGTKRISFKITGISIMKAAVSGLSEQNFIYEGINITPSIQFSIKSNADEAEKILMMGTDYTVTWQKNRNAGTATVVFAGKGGYTGTLKKTFKIGKFDIAANTDGRFTAELEQETVPYAKSGAKPKVTVRFKKSDGSLQTLVEGQDYTVSCRNNTAVNNGSRADKQPTLTVKGKGNFSGTFGTVLTYKIAAQDIGQLTLSAQDRTYQNKKNIYATKVTVTDLNGKTLKAGMDYSKNFTYTYKNETTVMNAVDYGMMIRAAGDLIDKNDIIPAGTVLVVTAAAKDGGNYSGTVTGEYRITQAAISSASVSIPKQTYTGREIILDKSQITVKIKGNLVDQSQYEIVPGSYKNNVKKGTASVTIRGIDNYGGTKTVKFSIGAKGFLWWWK